MMKADKFSVDMPLDRARSDDYDALLLPGRSEIRINLMMTRAIEFVTVSLQQENR